ncbi:Hypothetical predicted protein, partial [Paramuricea clavata]
ETSLGYFVPNQPIRVHVDAEKKTEGANNVPGDMCAILTQQDSAGAWKMCHVANRSLTDQYLVGAPKFEIFTDCKPLEYLFNNPTSRAPIRIERQNLAIQGLDYIVRYEKGKLNIADYGSRHITKEQSDHDIRAVQFFEEEVGAFLFEPDSESEHIILTRASEDKNYQKAFVDEAHRIGHSGEKRTVDLLRERVWFPGMTKMAKDVVKSCLSCQSTFDRTYDEPLRSTPLPPNVWHTISVDFKGPLKDGRYILVAYDVTQSWDIANQLRLKTSSQF